MATKLVTEIADTWLKVVFIRENSENEPEEIAIPCAYAPASQAPKVALELASRAGSLGFIPGLGGAIQRSGITSTFWLHGDAELVDSILAVYPGEADVEERTITHVAPSDRHWLVLPERLAIRKEDEARHMTLAIRFRGERKVVKPQPPVEAEA